MIDDVVFVKRDAASFFLTRANRSSAESTVNLRLGRETFLHFSVYNVCKILNRKTSKPGGNISNSLRTF